MNANVWGDDLPDSDLPLEVFRSPGRFTDLLRGKGDLGGNVRVTLGRAAEAVRAGSFDRLDERQRAALFFVQHVLLAEGADFYRVLGLRRGADSDEIRDHYHLLIRILHPDRAGWLGIDCVALAARINIAHQTLSDSAKRFTYDRQLSDPAGFGDPAVRTPAKPSATQTQGLLAALVSMLPHGVQRNLAQSVLGGVALLGIALVAGAYFSRPPAVVRTALEGHASVKSEAPPPTREASGARPVAPADLSDAAPAVVPVAPLRSALTQSDVPAGALATPEMVPARPKPTLPAPDRPQVERQISVVADGDKLPVAVAPVPAPVTAVREQEVRPAAGQRQVANDKVVEGGAVSNVMDAPQRQGEGSGPDKVAESGAGGAQPVRMIEVAQPVSEAAAPHAGIQPDEARAMALRFADAYRKGQIDAFLALFAPDARSPSGGLAEIRNDYATLFRDSGVRNIELGDFRWSFNGSGAQGECAFVVRLRRKGAAADDEYSGRLRFELVKLNGEVRIRGLFHKSA